MPCRPLIRKGSGDHKKVWYHGPGLEPPTPVAFDWRVHRFGFRRSPAPDPLVADLESVVAEVHARPAGRFLAGRDASVYQGGQSGPVCFPRNTSEVRALVEVANRHQRAVVPRGAGTGLAGGAVPLGDPVVITTTRMNNIGPVDLDSRTVWVEPGVINLDLSRHLQPQGYHFAPDPSSQQACTIGGNIANNSGGPHCLAYGVTSAHVLAVEMVTPQAEVVTLGGLESEPTGYDLRGVVVGSEGMLGIVTGAAVRVTPNPQTVATMLVSFNDVSAAAGVVSDIISAGIVPAAIEMMDQLIIGAIERFANAGYPTDVAAVLLIEVDGQPAGVAVDVAAIRTIASDGGAGEIRIAADENERMLLWKGRKAAFGAIAQIKPDYYLHDTVVPRKGLVQVMEAIAETARRHDVLIMNVFHAGDGNLHPLIIYDARDADERERVQAAGRDIIEASLAAGGVLSGEHGIGVEKRDYMDQLFTDVDLDQQSRLRAAFDPQCRSNPAKVLPSPHSCADIAAMEQPAAGLWV